MNDFTRSFKKIVPSIRESMLEAIETTPLKGERLMIPGRDCEIEVFLHKSSRKHVPVLFEFHGGGFVLGDARKDDNLCEIIKNALDINVVGVNYRKAPEYQYPFAINDAFDVMNYFYNHEKDLLVDKERFGVIGFSAGANLATIMAMEAVATKAFSLKCQILHYPYLDGVSDPSKKKKHEADLPVEVMEAFIELYAEGSDARGSYISPLYATKEQLFNTAPAWLFMAGEDALCEEGISYAKRLKEAGVSAVTKVVSEMHHGYMEDYFNKACYQLNPKDTIEKHSKNMEKRALEAIKETILILESQFA